MGTLPRAPVTIESLAQQALNDAADRASKVQWIAASHALKELQYCDSLLRRTQEVPQRVRERYALHVAHVCAGVRAMLPHLSPAAVRAELEVLLQQVVATLDEFALPRTRDL
jgi:hypothetical protein